MKPLLDDFMTCLIKDYVDEAQRIVDNFVYKNISLLLVQPSGCEIDELIKKIKKDLKVLKTDNQLLAIVNSQTIKTEDELVDLLIKNFKKGNKNVGELYLEYLDELIEDYGEESKAPAKDRLKAFCEFLYDEDYTFLLVIQKFQKLFYDMNMSSEFLATLRGLEQDSIVSTLNISSLPYDKLFEIRAQKETSFTSDYGNIHISISIYNYNHEQSEELWMHRISSELGDTDSTYNYHFQICYLLTGGYPIALESAISIFVSNKKFTDPLLYEKELLQKLPGLYKRLFTLDDKSKLDLKLAKSLSKCFLGNDTAEDLKVIIRHPFVSVLNVLNEENKIKICRCLGICATNIIMNEKEGFNDPLELYHNKYYYGVIEASSIYVDVVEEKLLLLSEIMYSIFGKSPTTYSFSEANWGQVENKIKLALSKFNNDKTNQELNTWLKIVNAYNDWKNVELKQDNIELHIHDLTKKYDGVDLAILYLGTRILLIKNSPTLFSVHLAIPVIEDLLRYYVNIILNKPANGSAFIGVNNESFQKWWHRKTKFEIPAPEQKRLSSIELIILTAALSEIHGSNVFSSSNEIAKIVSIIDSIRNTHGHYVCAGTKGTYKKFDFLEPIISLFNLLVKNSNCQYDLDFIEKLISRPIHYSYV
ncbi:MAG: hypothetical protein GY828_06330 [Candidatus Gracilibacteria bacterium]|nr:hypothetical protein [Candidatus Gracilibacteria bacterium]